MCATLHPCSTPPQPKEQSARKNAGPGKPLDKRSFGPSAVKFELNAMGTKITFSKCRLDDLGGMNEDSVEDFRLTYVQNSGTRLQFPPQAQSRIKRNLNVEASRNLHDSKQLAFAHIGPIEDVVKGFFGRFSAREDGNEKLESLEALKSCTQDVVKKAGLYFGLGKRSVKFEVSTWSPGKGETLAVLVAVHPQRGIWDMIAHVFRGKLQQEPAVQVVFSGSEIPVFRTATDADLWRALVPTTPLDTPGPRSLKVEVADARYEAFEGLVDVTDKEYPVESIWLPKTKSKIRGTIMEKERVGAFISILSEEQLWRGQFVLPSTGEITTGYGLQRYYNGVFAEKYYHRGVDYGAYEGDPVKAPANGRVVLVGKEQDGFEIHGNCVGLDHGQGVTSILMHLNSSFVKEGEMVQAGQIVGTVGETGIATGPHLHWGLYVRGEAVDPHPWMQEQIWV